MESVSQILLEYGLWGLGLIAFLGGTVLPLSSEIAVLGAVAMGLPWQGVLLAAGIGNSLAVCLNYFSGYFTLTWILGMFKIAPSYSEWLKRWGLWVVWISWLPIIGDPITLVSGLARLPWIRVLLIALPLRWLRYGILLYPWG